MKALNRQVKNLVLINARHFACVLLLLSATVAFATPNPGKTYTYDAEGRLIQATISDGTTSVQITYTYDRAGNLTNVSQQRLN